jgi:hypothetical protein
MVLSNVSKWDVPKLVINIAFFIPSTPIKKPLSTWIEVKVQDKYNGNINPPILISLSFPPKD